MDLPVIKGDINLDCNLNFIIFSKIYGQNFQIMSGSNKAKKQYVPNVCSIKFRRKKYCINTVFTTKFNGAEVTKGQLISKANFPVLI